MVDATVGGLGLSQVPISMVRADIDAGRLQTVLDEFSSVDVDIHAVWPRQAQLSPRVRFIVDQLVIFAADGRLD
jgi:DNA-binding transcriptional LysR family regulator